MEIALRKIEPEDVEILSALAKQTFYDTFTGTCTEEDMQNFLEKYFNPSRMQAELNDVDGFNFFAIVDNVPVGYIQFKEDYSSFAEIKKWRSLELKRLYVQKEFHGKGIANMLMNLFLDHARQHTYEVAWLGVWEFNFRAQKFYRKYGFEDSGHGHPFPIGNTPQTDRWFWKFLK